jgi:gamma-glutamylputrescine oxidase
LKLTQFKNGYQARADAVTYPSLKGEKQVSVCVVGGGYAGLHTAVKLQQQGISDVLLLEAGEPGSGASGRNGGFVFGGYALGEQALIKQLGADTAKWMYGLTLDAVQEIRDTAMQAPDQCHWNDGGVVLANWFNDASILDQREETLNVLGAPTKRLTEQQTRAFVRSAQYHDGLKEVVSGHFDPWRFCQWLAAQIAAKGDLYSHSTVHDIKRQGSKWRIKTKNGLVIANELVICGGGYLNQAFPALRKAMLPIATYVLMSQPLGDAIDAYIPGNAAIYDTRFAFDYYRKLPDQRLLWGGRIAAFAPKMQTIEQQLTRDIKQVFPDMETLAVDYCWQGMMSYARHQMPQIGRHRDGYWYAQSFGGHGVSTTAVAGKLLAEAIVGDESSLKEFSRYGLQNTYGLAGKMAAQSTYWLYQLADRLRS